MLRLFDRPLLWAPRVFGIVVSLFLALFALDAFSVSRPLIASSVDFLIHLVPAMLVCIAVIVSWRRPAIGAAAFVALAVGYAALAQRVDWVLVISGPLLVVGVLFLLSWRAQHLRPRVP